MSLRRNSLIFIITGLFLAAADTSAQSGVDVVNFYPVADSVTQTPFPIGRYEIKYRKNLMGRYVTFIGKKKDRKVLIAAITMEPIKSVQKDMRLSVEFHGPKPYIGEVSTWGYIFDRNGDGRIDYLALVGGAAAVEDSSITDDFPGFQNPMSRKQFEQYIEHTRIMFNHYADDNYDGEIDAVVHYDMDPIRNWMKRWLVVRSTKFDGQFEEVWAFRGKMSPNQEITNFTPTEVPYYELGSDRSVMTKQVFDEASGFLQLINRALAECKIKPDQLLH